MLRDDSVEVLRADTAEVLRVDPVEVLRVDWVEVPVDLVEDDLDKILILDLL